MYFAVFLIPSKAPGLGFMSGLVKRSVWHAVEVSGELLRNAPSPPETPGIGRIAEVVAVGTDPIGHENPPVGAGMPHNADGVVEIATPVTTRVACGWGVGGASMGYCSVLETPLGVASSPKQYDVRRSVGPLPVGSSVVVVVAVRVRYAPMG